MGSAQQKFENLARTATKCRECFRGSELKSPDIDVAQPRWVGQNYWDSSFRVAILMINPGESSKRDAPWAKEVRVWIRKFRDGKLKLRTLLDDQREAMAWSEFYTKNLDLTLDRIAFVNVAWCATAGNIYPVWMLEQCFRQHTGPLLDLLRPDVVVVAGRKAQAFAGRIHDRLSIPVINVLHHAHRESRGVEESELARVRAELKAVRATRRQYPKT